MDAKISWCWLYCCCYSVLEPKNRLKAINQNIGLISNHLMAWKELLIQPLERCYVPIILYEHAGGRTINSICQFTINLIAIILILSLKFNTYDSRFIFISFSIIFVFLVTWRFVRKLIVSLVGQSFINWSLVHSKLYLSDGSNVNDMLNY